MTSFRCLIKGILRCEKVLPGDRKPKKLIQTKPKRADLVAFLSVYSCGETTNPMFCHFVVALLCTLQDLSE